MTSRRSQAMIKSKWFVPSVTAALGLPVLAASWIGGHPGVGVTGLAIMVAYGLFLLLAGSRSDTMRWLRGDGRDERFAMIDMRATAFTGITIIVAVIVAWMVEVARGHSGSPFDWLGAVAGLAYIAAVAFLRWRG